MKNHFMEALEDCPVIAAVKDMEGLEQCFTSDSKIIFILFGDICTIGSIVEKVKQQNRIAMVHMDLLTGISSKEISIDFIHQNTKADGIISTKPNLIKRARELDMFTVLRVFMLDSMAYDNIARQCSQCRPDCIEVLPGVMPKVISRICKAERTPIIAGGLISDKEDVMSALQAGAVSISTTKRELWFV